MPRAFCSRCRPRAPCPTNTRWHHSAQHRDPARARPLRATGCERGLDRTGAAGADDDDRCGGVEARVRIDDDAHRLRSARPFELLLDPVRSTQRASVLPGAANDLHAERQID